MRTVTLNNGVEMPILGFGVYQIPPEETEQAVTDALAAGYRHLDTAAAYGNEEAVGRAIADSGIARDELFVTTKLWIQDARRGEHQAGVRDLAAASRPRLPRPVPDPPALRRLLRLRGARWRSSHREGRVRAIGVVQLLPRPARRPHRPQRGHPGGQPDRDPPLLPARRPTSELMREHGVQIESWGPFAEGRNNLFTNPTLTEIGAAHGKSVAQVVLRWLIQRDVVVIPKSVRAERMARELRRLRLRRSPTSEMTRIAALDTGATPVLRPPRPRHGQPARQPSASTDIDQAANHKARRSNQSQRNALICRDPRVPAPAAASADGSSAPRAGRDRRTPRVSRR